MFFKKKNMEKELYEYNKKQEEIDLEIKKAKQKYTFKSFLSRMKFETYTKRLVFIVVLVGLVDLQLSYILAFMGKPQIAETLSNQICVTLLGTVVVYATRAYFDTKAEKRDEMIREGLIDPNTKNIKTKILDNKVIKSSSSIIPEDSNDDLTL